MCACACGLKQERAARFCELHTSHVLLKQSFIIAVGTLEEHFLSLSLILALLVGAVA